MADRYHALTVDEVAAALDMSKATVERLIRSGLKKLRGNPVTARIKELALERRRLQDHREATAG